MHRALCFIEDEEIRFVEVGDRNPRRAGTEEQVDLLLLGDFRQRRQPRRVVAKRHRRHQAQLEQVLLDALDCGDDVRLKTGHVVTWGESDPRQVADRRGQIAGECPFSRQRSSACGDGGFKSHDVRDLRRLPFSSPETVEQKLREGKPHRTPFLDRAVKESAREEAFERREEARLCQNNSGRDLELLGQSPECPSSSERIVTPCSAIDAEQLAPLGLRQIESAQCPPRRGVNLFNELLVEEHPNHKLLKRVVTHCVFPRREETQPTEDSGETQVIVDQSSAGKIEFSLAKTSRVSSGALRSHSKTMAFRFFARGTAYSRISQVAGSGSGEWLSSM